MLLRLKIRNFAIVDEAELEFSPGLNIITGETGAGKSILIRALTTLSGSKTSPDLIRKGAEQASVVGVFEIPFDHPVLAQIQELGIESSDAGDGRRQVILRRTIGNKGRSLSYINDCMASTLSLSKISRHLLDIFGQHENQRLLDSAEHFRYLDLFLQDRKVFENYRIGYDGVSSALLELKTFSRENLSRERDKDYLQFRLNELESLAPSEEDFDLLETSGSRQSKIQNWRMAIARSREVVDEGSDGNSIGAAFEQVSKDLATASDAHESIIELVGLSKNLSNLAEDLSYRINQIAGKLESEECETAFSQERLDQYYSLMHKTACRSVKELISSWKKLQDEVELVEGAQEHIEKLQRDLVAKIAILKIAGKELSLARRVAAEKIQKAVQNELADLGIPDAKFVAEFSNFASDLSKDHEFSGLVLGLDELIEEFRQFSVRGPESIQFLLGANRGEACLPLEKFASGGEVSRIMLAIKKAMAVDAGTCVMVFDEIDTGISGRIADRVGKKLAELSNLFQVLCISHLPQVAVYADVNLSVRKSTGAQRTTSQIIRLEKSSDVVDEIANLLSGPELSVSSRKNARDLIAKAAENKRPH